MQDCRIIQYMKLEKINENQIRCTLTREDLASRHIRLSELAYGSDKAKKLFQDMMQEAGSRLGFHADNIPLMIEAIPVSEGSIMLIITKVEDPEELDTRFAKFAPAKKGPEAAAKPVEDADDILNLIHKLYEIKKKAATPSPDSGDPSGNSPAAETPSGPAASARVQTPQKQSVGAAGSAVDFVRLYTFDDLDTVIDVSSVLSGRYQGFNTLYRADNGERYHLVVHKSAHTPEEFNRVCNILAEYGRSQACSPASEAHLQEHAVLMIEANALQKLYSLAAV